MTSEASQGWRERLRRQALPALVGALVGGALVAWGGSREPAASESAPGEPAQAHPGQSHSGHAHSGHGAEDPTQAGSGWTCAMHPQVRQPAAGACPLCGMDLIPASSEASSEGPGRVALSPRARALARLRVAPVRRRADGASTLRLLGRFETNERSERLVTAWTGGRIERLRVSATGERVRAGQVVATLYSPEVFAAHQDLRVAAQQVARLAGSPEATRRAAEGALDAARDRLRLLGVAEGTLERMERAEQPTRSVPVRSPFAGTVMERLVSAGAYVTTGTPLLRVANLRSLWLQLDAYESDLGRLAIGQRVELTVDGLPGETFPGEVSFVDPTLDPVQRTARVRVVVENASGRLRPGMSATATLESAAVSGAVPDAASDAESDAPASGEGPLVVPKTAPLFTGRRALVYVEVEAGSYAPRTVRLGPRLGDVYPVLEGLAEGERVVVSGAFVLDADLQIRGGPSMMAAAAPVAPLRTPTAEEREALAAALEAYLAVQRALADDAFAVAQEGARALVAALASARFGEENAPAWEAIARQLRAPATALAGAATLEAARGSFEALSGGALRLLERFGNPLRAPLHVAFCPMVADFDGALWVQQGEVIDNAYFGDAMLTCGEIRAEVAPGSHLPAGAAGAVPRP